jgi:hypothetical protein
MNSEQVIGDLVKLFQHYETVLPGADLHQEPYKGDFFKLFAIAYNAGFMKTNPESFPFLRADALIPLIDSRAPGIVDGKNFKIVHGFWREWTYAWDNVGSFYKQASDRNLAATAH